MNRRLLLTLPVFIVAVFSIQAQNTDTVKLKQAAGVTLGAHIGTQGVGISCWYPLGNKLQLGVSTSFAPYGISRVKSWNEYSYDLDMKTRLGNVGVFLEYLPFRSEGETGLLSKLNVTGGIAYFYKATATATGKPSDNYVLGELVIDKEDIGTVTADVKWNAPVSPYLGVGISELQLGKALALKIDLGTYYLSSPDVKVRADKLLAGNTTNEAVLQNNLKEYRWLPVIQAGLVYKF